MYTGAEDFEIGRYNTFPENGMHVNKVGCLALITLCVWAGVEL